MNVKSFQEKSKPTLSEKAKPIPIMNPAYMEHILTLNAPKPTTHTMAQNSK